MSKHHRAFKIKLAQLSEKYSSSLLGALYGVRRNLIRCWSQVYRIHGENSFTHKQQPYTREFKLRALATMMQNKWSMTHTRAYVNL